MILEKVTNPHDPWNKENLTIGNILEVLHQARKNGLSIVNGKLTYASNESVSSSSHNKRKSLRESPIQMEADIESTKHNRRDRIRHLRL